MRASASVGLQGETGARGQRAAGGRLRALNHSRVNHSSAAVAGLCHGKGMCLLNRNSPRFAASISSRSGPVACSASVGTKSPVEKAARKGKAKEVS